MGLLEAKNPKILSDSRYEKFFQGILKDTQRAYKHLGGERQTIENNLVKTSISKVLRGIDQEEDFNERFLIKPKLRCKTARSLKKNLHMGPVRVEKEVEDEVGLTRLEREAEFRNYFFSDSKKIINLEEQSMLLEYFLKDEDAQQKQ